MKRLIYDGFDFLNIFFEEIFGKRRVEPVGATILFHALLILMFFPLAWFLGVVLRLLNVNWLARIFVNSIGVIWFAFLASEGAIEEGLLFVMSTPFRGTITWSILTVPFAGFVEIFISAWKYGKDVFMPNSIESELQKVKSAEVREVARNKKIAQRRARAGNKSRKGEIALGTFQSGDKFPSGSGFVKSGVWVSMLDRIINQHMFILGTTGSGKTETLSRIISEVLKNTDRRVYVIDGKGDLDWAGKIATMGYQNDRGQVPIFKLGHQHKGAIYNGFMGNPEDIYNRLASLCGALVIHGNAEHYMNRKKRLLQLICGMGEVEKEVFSRRELLPPRSFEEVEERLSADWLLKTYAGTSKVTGIKRLSKDGDIVNLSLEIENLSASFGSVVNSDGFTLEGVKCAVFSILTQSASIDAKKFLDFFVEDMKDWIGKRQPKGVTGLLVIDEFGTFGNENITNILSLARSAGLGVILATQSMAKLGEGGEADKIKILANCNTYMLMKTNFPDEMIDLAGTVLQVEASHQLVEGGEQTGMGSARFQHQYAIDPNKVAQLQAGEGYLVNSRYMARLQVAQINRVETDKKAIAPNPKRTVRAGANGESKEGGEKPVVDKGVEIPI